jgi:DNA-directed RNA polymerase specialized sigma24 family protein
MFKNHPLSQKGLDEQIFLLIENASVSAPSEHDIVLLADIENQLLRLSDLVTSVYVLYYKHGFNTQNISEKIKVTKKEVDHTVDTIRQTVCALILNW